MKILVVDDDPIVAKTLKILLSGYNHAVDIAEDGEAGFQMADAFDYDLILLDVILPKLDGISLCQQLRRQGLQSPILLLTGHEEGGQKTIALNAGADGYIVKPFDADELIAQVHALLRRGNSATQPILAWGDLCIDPSSRNVTYSTQLLNLTPKEYAILELFLRNPQRVFSAAAILDHAWNSVESPGEEAVRVHIKELRHKLQAVGAPRDFIKTVYRIGYRLNPLYASILAEQTKTLLTPPQIAELQSVNQELRAALEQLQATQEELRQKNQELENAYQTIECERHVLQISQNQLEQRVAVRTAELERAEQRNREQAALLNITSDAIFVHDLDHRILYWNRGAERLYGWQNSEAIDQQADQLLPNCDPQLNAIRQSLMEQGTWRGEIRRLTKTGQEVLVEARWTLVRNQAGQPRFILSVETDITEKKQLEAQFYHAQRLESMGTLASGIAHDLNNVLTPILSLTQLLQLQLPNLASQSVELLQMLEDSAKRGTMMAKQILTFTKGSNAEMGLVKSYGGFWQVSSQLQKGTQFKVCSSSAEGKAMEDKSSEVLLWGEGELILIVDDDPVVRRTNQVLLETYHYNTLTASDGIEAIAQYARNQAQIKAVLIDVVMPNMDGITAVQTLREIDEEAKIIAVSGLSANREPVMTAGANVFLSKPYALETLLENLHFLIKSLSDQ